MGDFVPPFTRAQFAALQGLIRAEAVLAAKEASGKCDAAIGKAIKRKAEAEQRARVLLVEGEGV